MSEEFIKCFRPFKRAAMMPVDISPRFISEEDFLTQHLARRIVRERAANAFPGVKSPTDPTREHGNTAGEGERGREKERHSSDSNSFHSRLTAAFLLPLVVTPKTETSARKRARVNDSSKVPVVPTLGFYVPPSTTK
ncbi:hypothetical protein EYF80_040006 [Liparis tanakae]|uniref:Uncharacterized protein n=1 Tax=Liparis tanakae TaxID=230148 RepID=A0A4Z2GAZ8_9TELE|nr:hypothetical protein EYF80_040006 [Liparis tanakae]